MIAAAVEENLSFIFEAAEGARMNYAIAVPLVMGAPLRRSFGKLAPARGVTKLCVRREELPLPGFQFNARCWHRENSVRQQSLDGHAAQLKQPPNGVLDQI